MSTEYKQVALSSDTENAIVSTVGVVSGFMASALWYMVAIHGDDIARTISMIPGFNRAESMALLLYLIGWAGVYLSPFMGLALACDVYSDAKPDPHEIVVDGVRYREVVR